MHQDSCGRRVMAASSPHGAYLAVYCLHSHVRPLRTGLGGKDEKQLGCLLGLTIRKVVLRIHNPCARRAGRAAADRDAQERDEQRFLEVRMCVQCVHVSLVLHVVRTAGGTSVRHKGG